MRKLISDIDCKLKHALKPIEIQLLEHEQVMNFGLRAFRFF